MTFSFLSRTSTQACLGIAAAVGIAAFAVSVAPLFGQEITPPSTQLVAETSTTGPAATQPGQARTEQDIMNDMQATSAKLREFLSGPEVFNDRDKRAAAAPKAIPLLKQMSSILDEMVKIQPAAKPQAEEAQTQFLMFLSLFGDADSTAHLQQLADSKDPSEAIRGKSTQLLTRWVNAAKDAPAQTKVVDDAEKLAKEHPDSTLLTGHLLSMTSLSPATPELTARIEHLVTDVMKNPVAENASEQIAGARKLREIVDKPLVITGKKLDGKDFSTADWKGKVVLVDFWATWCGPCLGELPRVKKVYAENHDKGLEIVGVSNDNTADDLKQFLDQNKDMPWPQLFDSAAAAQQKWNSISQSFGVNSIPTMFLIDKKGIVRSVTARETLEEMLPKLLAEKD